MTARIVLTGPECTGKTTLTVQLAKRFDAPWVPEASRAYAVRERRPLTAADVEPIARLQMEYEDVAVAGKPPVAFLDTDLLSTIAYARHYYGKSGAWLEAAARARPGDLYLLCAPDLPWTADGVRDRPENRGAMYAHFEGVLSEFGAVVRTVHGTGTARLAAAVGAVSAALEGAP